MGDVLHTIRQWVDKGVHSLDTCVAPLEGQMGTWQKTLDDIVTSFRENIITLKQVDDRIDNGTLQIVLTTEIHLSNKEKITDCCEIYRK